MPALQEAIDKYCEDLVTVICRLKYFRIDPENRDDRQDQAIENIATLLREFYSHGHWAPNEDRIEWILLLLGPAGAPRDPFDGDSNELSKIRATSDRFIGRVDLQDEITRLESVVQADIMRQHDTFLRDRGLGPARVVRTNAGHRVTHCYNCQDDLDNEIDFECERCGWIICSCGACGCGYTLR